MKKAKSRKAKPSKLVTREEYIKTEPLTQAKLVKLYEEFKEKKRKEHEKRVVKYEQGMMERLKDSLEQWRGMCLGSREIPKWIKGEDFVMKYDKILDNKPTYTEPTFNEFMESLKEKPELKVFRSGNYMYSYNPQTGEYIFKSEY